jgi:hypothetical protein
LQGTVISFAEHHQPRKGAQIPGDVSLIYERQEVGKLLHWAINQLLPRDTIVEQMTENAEKVYIKQVSAVDVAAIDRRQQELDKEMSTLVKLNLTAGVNTEIYAAEYNRIMVRWRIFEIRGKMLRMPKSRAGKHKVVDILLFWCSTS